MPREHEIVLEEQINLADSISNYYPSSSATFDSGSIKSTVERIFSVKPELLDYFQKYDEEKQRKKISEEQIISDLSKAYKENNLVLVLGSGVTHSQGGPLWNELINKLMTKAIKNIRKISEDKAEVVATLLLDQFPKNPLLQARFIRNHVGRKNYSFELLVENIIYEKTDLNIKSLFTEIIKFCKTYNERKRLDSIITYNYDDLIEYFCEKDADNIPYKCVYSQDTLTSRTGIPIYHVHGYLPKHSTMKDKKLKKKIILSEETYHEQYSILYNWSNLIQLNKFINKNCLFIGLSLEDPNMRRLLDYAHEHCEGKNPHYAIVLEKNDEDIIGKIKSRLKQDDELLDRKTNSGLSFDDACRLVINQILDLEEEDRKSFGINTYGVEDYSKIPEILKKIREA